MDKKKRRYRLYIDESGGHDYGRLDDPPYRYLGVLGIWFEQQTDYVEFADSLEQLKRRIFGPRPDDPIHLHRKDAICRVGPFGILNSAAIREQFDEGLVEIVSQARFKMTCVVIDKKRHLETYADAAFHPYHDCILSIFNGC